MDLNSLRQTLGRGCQYITNLLRPMFSLAIRYPKIMILVFLVILFILYCISTFPEEFSHIQPEVFDSFEYAQDSYQPRDLKAMRPKVFQNDLITKCPDIEVTKKQIVYCINTNRQIVQLNPHQNYAQVLYTIEQGDSQGLRLSKDQKLLYFTNSNLGLCEFNIKKRKVKTLVAQYQGQFLISLNGVQIHPKNPNILYFTQTSKIIPMQRFEIQFWLRNPLGRVFQFNKKTLKISLIAEGLYSPNGIVFKKYNNEDVLVVSETNRNRLIRIFLTGDKIGQKQIALDKLQLYPDNIKAGEKGEILVGSIGFRDAFSKYIDENGWIRKIYSRIPGIETTIQNYDFGGMIVKLAQNSQEESKIKYWCWESYPNFSATSTLLMRGGNLFMSSQFDFGILVIDKIRKRLNDRSVYEDFSHTKKQMWVYKFGDRFERKQSIFS